MADPKLRRICLMRGPGTLPSQGADRMDLTHYNARFSGKGLMSTRDMVAGDKVEVEITGLGILRNAIVAET